MESNTSNSSESIVNTAVAKKKTPTLTASFNPYLFSKNMNGEAAELSEKSRKKKSDNPQEISTVEEFSYKKSTPQEANSEEILQNNAAVIPTGNENARTSFKQGMYYGFALMVLLVNLMCYFIFEERLFLFYCLALAGVTAVFFYNDGIHHLFGMSTPSEPFLMQTFLLWVATSFSALFASKYLTLEEFFPKLKFITSPLIIIGGVLIGAAYLAEGTTIAYTANFVSISVLVCYFGASVFLFSRKNYAKFYAIAAFIPLLFAVDFFVLKNIGVNFLSTEATHIKIAGLIEMLILTYAIVYRMRAIKEEHEMRQTEMRIFLKRQEAINRQSAVKLMEEVYLENLIMHYDLDGLEIKLLQYISEGKENSKIARKLKTTEADVEELTKELYEKLEIGEQIQEDFRLLDSQPDYLYN
ncbi:MAG: 7TM-DISM domain-containing protein [Marinirhabdus sp.]|nr:7TM-DISM domain-containing protein [Marinirhabdus sp.]